MQQNLNWLHKAVLMINGGCIDVKKYIINGHSFFLNARLFLFVDKLMIA